MQTFLKQWLESRYEIAEATDGHSALQQAFDVVPDLIVIDIIVPGKVGVALTTLLKSDVRTSQIPIVMLTAKTKMESRLEGRKAFADAYVIKPFNMAFWSRQSKACWPTV